MPYDIFPAVDENHNFPPEVQQALKTIFEYGGSHQLTIDPRMTGALPFAVGHVDTFTESGDWYVNADNGKETNGYPKSTVFVLSVRGEGTNQRILQTLVGIKAPEFQGDIEIWYRNWWGTGWTPWTKVVTDRVFKSHASNHYITGEDPITVDNRQLGNLVMDSADLLTADEMKATGKFYYTAGPERLTQGFPTAGPFELDVERVYSGSRIFHTVTEPTLNGHPKVWRRTFWDDTWSDWDQSVTRNQFKSQDDGVGLPLGLNADLPGYAAEFSVKHYQSPYYNCATSMLTDIREKIAAAQRGERRTEIVFLGDSKTDGRGVEPNHPGEVYKYSYPDQFRRMMGGSEGFASAHIGNSHWDHRWVAENMIRVGSERQGIIPTGVSTTADLKRVTFTSDHAFTAFQVYLRIPGGGNVTITVDGVDINAVAIVDQEQWSQRGVTSLDNTNHTIVIESYDPIEVAGISFGYPDNRLITTRASRGGSNAAHWISPTQYHLWRTALRVTTPDLFVVQIGTNNPQDVQSIIDFYNQINLNGTPTIAVVPGGLNPDNQTANFQEVFKTTYNRSNVYGFPLIDFMQVIGDHTFADKNGLMMDGVHETADAYFLEAKALYDLLT